MCLILNSSVNSYRRLDPKFEAPNEIKMSDRDRGSMIRFPIGNEKSSRLEVRSIAPDCNPYMCNMVLLKTGLIGIENIENSSMDEILNKREKLPSNIYDAMRYFKNSKVIEEIIGSDVQEKYYDLKEKTANRCPKSLGNLVKKEEIIYHHEITNQILWGKF
jgi:glutamine synthetase